MTTRLNTTTIKILKRNLMRGIRCACPLVVNAPLVVILAHKIGFGVIKFIANEGYTVSQYFIYSEHEKTNSSKKTESQVINNGSKNNNMFYSLINELNRK